MKKDQFGKLRTSKSPAGRYLLTESTGSKSEVESFKTKLDELAKRLSNTSNKREVDRNSSSEQSDVDLKSKIIKGERKSLEFLRA